METSESARVHCLASTLSLDRHHPLPRVTIKRRAKAKKKAAVKTLATVDGRYSFPTIPEDRPLPPSPIFEAGRDFIVLELGEYERVPALLPYEAGIHFVRARLIDEFCPESLDELMQIVFDLIENKDNALGIGDEGDCWASW